MTDIRKRKRNKLPPKLGVLKPYHGPWRLPPGRKRDDYEPEALVEMDRARKRKKDRRHRANLRRRGITGVHLRLGPGPREGLEALRDATGLTNSEIVAQLVLDAWARIQQEPEEGP